MVGSSVTVVATPQPGFVFNGWSEGDKTVSNSATYTFQADADRTLVAQFANMRLDDLRTSATVAHAITPHPNPLPQGERERGARV